MALQDRSSEADGIKLVTDSQEIARIEAENTLRQFDMGMDELGRWISDPEYQLRVSTILKLNRAALDGLSRYAGTFRPSGITIRGSGHAPVSAEQVPELMEEFCEYIRREWHEKSPIHLAAFALWRLNWIHPFVDGNGRTARVVSYVILCAKLGYRIPGKVTISEHIAANKQPYYRALEAADAACPPALPTYDVSMLERLIESLLASQLLKVHEAATGRVVADRSADASYPTTNAPAPKLHEPEPRWAWVGHMERHPVMYGGIFVLLATLITVLFAN